MVRTCVYVSNAESKEIFVLSMDLDSGALELIERVPVPGTGFPSPTSLPLAVSPNRRFLYAALRSPPYPVSSFAIDPSSGRLKHLAMAPLVSAMAYIVTDRSGRYLLSASYTDATLSINPIDANGRIESGATQVIATGPNAHCVVVDAANHFAYCAILGADVVMQLVFDSSSGIFLPNKPPSVPTRKGAGCPRSAGRPRRARRAWRGGARALFPPLLHYTARVQRPDPALQVQRKSDGGALHLESELRCRGRRAKRVRPAQPEADSLKVRFSRPCVAPNPSRE
jgi:Lactonase, 7-bladed beta-propeller